MKHRLLLFGAALLMSFNSALAQTTIIKGLTVIVEFVGNPFVESNDSVALMMNQTDFSGWGNEGSVKDFFLTQSNGKVLITSEVIRVSLPYGKTTYYGDNATRNDVSDVVDAINIKYPTGFQGLTLKSDNSLVHFNMLTKVGGGAWAFGVQPGSNTIKNNGQNVYVNSGNITNYDTNEQPQYNTICHEMGHSVMGWPDHYQTAWSNLGNYAVMASAGNRKQPQMINPALRLQKGWIDNVIEVGNSSQDQTYTATSNSYSTVYKYTNPYNSHEYLLLYSYTYGKYFQQYLSDVDVADQGLAIYYVDELEGMDKASSDPDYQIKLVTADNLDELHDEDLRFAANSRDIRGDFNDLYDNVSNSFPAGTPFRWKDGGEFGLNLGEISAPGSTMNFTVYARGIKHLATSGKNGTISPKGVLTANVPITYAFLPNTGYEINTVKVNDVATTVAGNSLTVASGNKTVEVTYKRKTAQAALPAPWQSTNIGAQTPAGFAAIDAGKFLLENNSGDIWGSSDNFSFIYQPVAGDFTMVAEVKSLNKINNWSKAGIMVRESLSANAAYSMLMRTPRSNSRVQQRGSTNANSTDNPNGIEDLHLYNLYNWLKVERTGNVITSYVSLDQGSWTRLGEQTIVMGNEVYVGLALSGQNESEATIAQFENVSVTTVNLKPTVTITSPVSNASFVAPATITITANASDADGTVSKVDFFNGGTLIGTDYSAPYSFVWNNVSSGTYNIVAKATDNKGEYSYHVVSDIVVTNSTANIIGAVCGSSNTSLLYELSPSKKTNAISINWWYNGSSYGMYPVSGDASKATLSTGYNFGAGQVCVGINYNGAPWYASYCMNVAKCSSAREGMFEEDESVAISYPNPFTSETVIQIPVTTSAAQVQVYDASGVVLLSEQSTGEFRFGNDFKTGIYLVKISYDGKSETMKVVKQ